MHTSSELAQSVYNCVKELGGSEAEAQLYAVSIKLGPVPLSVLAEKLGWSRPTLYATIKLLEDRGLASLKTRKKFTRTFVVASPAILLDRLRLKMENVCRTEGTMISALPDLLSAYRQGEDHPNVKIIKGERDYIHFLRQLYQNSKDEVLFYGSFQGMLERLALNPMQIVGDFAKRQKSILRAILPDDPLIKALALLPHSTNLDVRFFSAKHNFGTSFHIAAHRVVIWQPQDWFAVIIEDQYVVAMFRHMFENMWENAAK